MGMLLTIAVLVLAAGLAALLLRVLSRDVTRARGGHESSAAKAPAAELPVAPEEPNPRADENGVLVLEAEALAAEPPVAPEEPNPRAGEGEVPVLEAEAPAAEPPVAPEEPNPRAGEGEVPVLEAEALARRQPVKPTVYRPPVRAPAKPKETRVVSEEGSTRDRALPIEVRVLFEKAGFCTVSLLPRRGSDFPGTLTVVGSGNPPELVALQDEWYEDILLPDVGALLQRGAAWESVLPDGRSIRWSLSGREIYVLSRYEQLSGFVSTPRLILGEQHVVLCTMARLQEVRHAIDLTGSPEPVMLDTASGIPTGWVGFGGVVPQVPVAPDPDGDILDALRPLADVEIVLEGGIRLERLTWLKDYPPRIRLRGNTGSICTVMIDGQEAVRDSDGGYAVPGWDLPGQHQVWCVSASRSYTIREGAEEWEAWDAYTWSLGELGPDGEQNRPAICGALVWPPRAAAKEGRVVLVPASNPILVGAVPGQVQSCGVRSDIGADMCSGFAWFDPVWAVPARSQADRHGARVLLIGAQRPVAGQDRLHRTRRIKAWCNAILHAKGLRAEPHTPGVAALWKEYKGYAKRLIRMGRR